MKVETSLETVQTEHSLDIDERLSLLVAEEEAKDRVRDIVIHGTLRREKELAEAKTEQERTIIKKQTFLKYYEMVQIVSAACEQAGIGRTTYYDWIRDDPQFKTAVYEAGATKNQYVEDKLMKLIAQDDGPSIRYYLDRKHPDFKPKGEMDLSPEGAKTLTTMIWEEGRRRFMAANGIKEPEEIKQIENGEPSQQ